MGWWSDFLFGDNGRSSAINSKNNPFAHKKTIYESPYGREHGVNPKSFFECDGVIYHIAWTSKSFSSGNYAKIEKKCDDNFKEYSYEIRDSSNDRQSICFANARALTIDEYKVLLTSKNSIFVTMSDIASDIILKYNNALKFNSNLSLRNNQNIYKVFDLYHIRHKNELFIFDGTNIIEKFDHNDLFNLSRYISYGMSNHKSVFEYDRQLCDVHLKHFGVDNFVDALVNTTYEEICDDDFNKMDFVSKIEAYEINLIKLRYDKIDEYIQDILTTHQELNNILDENEILKLVNITDYDSLVLFVKTVHNYKNIIDFEKLKWRDCDALDEKNRMHIEAYLKGIV